jgi:hypothetical protein
MYTRRRRFLDKCFLACATIASNHSMVHVQHMIQMAFVQ